MKNCNTILTEKLEKYKCYHLDYHAEARDELSKIENIKQQINRGDLVYQAGNEKQGKTSDFQKFKTIRSLSRKIYSGILNDAFVEQINLKDEIDRFNKCTTSNTRKKNKTNQ